MKKRGLILTALVLSMSVTAFAKTEKPKFDITDNSFNIAGKTETAISGKRVKIIIVKPGYTISDVASDRIVNAALVLDDIPTNAEGKYEYKYLMEQSDLSGEYTIYVQDDDSDNPQKFSLYYATDSFKKSAVANIVNPPAGKTFVQAVQEAVLPLALNSELVNKVGIGNVASIVGDYLTDNSLDSENFVESGKKLQQLVVVEAFNQGLTSDCIATDNSFVYDDIIGFSKVDNNGSTFANNYDDLLSDTAKSGVRNALFNQNFKDSDDLLAKYKEEIILQGISGGKDDGTGHISKLLTNANASALGKNNAFVLYNNVTNAIARKNIEIDLMKKSYSTIDEVSTELNRLVQLYDTTGGNPGGSGGGNGSGGAWGGSTGGAGVPNTFVPIETIDKNGEAVLFSDISDVPWAREAIESLYDKKIISGVGNNKFAPNTKITREQFIVMLVNSLNLPCDEETDKFSDVASGEYYSKHIAAALKAGIVNGVSEDVFGVGESITRQDICTMIYRAYFNEKTSDAEISFKDKDEINEYAYNPVAYMTALKIVNGFEDGSFAPKDICTRAQAAKILYGAMTTQE